MNISCPKVRWSFKRDHMLQTFFFFFYSMVNVSASFCEWDTAFGRNMLVPNGQIWVDQCLWPCDPGNHDGAIFYCDTHVPDRTTSAAWANYFGIGRHFALLCEREYRGEIRSFSPSDCWIAWLAISKVWGGTRMDSVRQMFNMLALVELKLRANGLWAQMHLAPPSVATPSAWMGPSSRTINTDWGYGREGCGCGGGRGRDRIISIKFSK